MKLPLNRKTLMPFKSNTLLKSRLCLDYLNGGNACLNSSFILQIVVWRNGRSYHLQVQTFFAFIWPVFSTDPSDGIIVSLNLRNRRLYLGIYVQRKFCACVGLVCCLFEKLICSRGRSTVEFLKHFFSLQIKPGKD